MRVDHNKRTTHPILHSAHLKQGSLDASGSGEDPNPELRQYTPISCPQMDSANLGIIGQVGPGAFHLGPVEDDRRCTRIARSAIITTPVWGKV